MKYLALMLILHSPVDSKLRRFVAYEVSKQIKSEAESYAKQFCSCLGGLSLISYGSSAFVFFCTKQSEYAYEIQYGDKYTGEVCI